MARRVGSDRAKNVAATLFGYAHISLHLHRLARSDTLENGRAAARAPRAGARARFG